MKTYELVMADGELDGMTLIRFERHNIRPLSAKMEGELGKIEDRKRDYPRPQEQTGTTTDPETGEEIPVYSNVPDIYQHWVGEPVAMTSEQRTARDAYDLAVYEASDEYATLIKITELRTQLATILSAFGLELPIDPVEAMSQLDELVTTDEQRDAVQKLQFIFMTLKIDYGLSNAQIGGLE